MKKYIFLILVLFLVSFATYSQDLLSQGKSCLASSTEGGNVANNAVDGNLDTRWSSNFATDENPDNAWWQVDLGAEYYVSSVNIQWENAFASEYKIQISDDVNFGSYTDIAHITAGDGGEDFVSTSNLVKGRYVRFQGITRSTGYGYSFWEFKVYGTTELVSATVTIDVPYVQFLKLGVSPKDNDGNSQFIIQNTGRQIQMNCYVGSQLNLSMLDFRGNYDVTFWALKDGSETDTVQGIPLSITVYDNLVIHVKLTAQPTNGNVPPVADAGLDQTIYWPVNSLIIDGSNSSDSDGSITSYQWIQMSGPTAATLSGANTPKLTVSNLNLGDYKFRLTLTDDSLATGHDDVVVSVLTPEQVDFLLISPADSSMVTDTRIPVLSWDACHGALNYKIYLNITRDDYEWSASGNLLDRYTKIGETTSTSFSVPTDLVDRWTYKWYVIAETADGTKFSDKKQFGLYIPYMEQETDGIDIINGCRDMNKNGTIEPFEDWHLSPETRLNDIMERLTTNEKVCQLFYGGNDNPLDGFAFSYGVESGMRETQYAASKTNMGIPIAYLGDKVHGWKTIYPTQLGLAATRNMDIVYQCGNMHRVEQKAFGFTGILSPLAEVDTKVLYPRFQEGSGENADDAASIIRALVCGMQGGPELNPHSLLITVKHWPSQGAGGESVLQYDSVTVKYHMKPWHAVVDANAASVMPGYNTCPYLDPLNGANSSKKVIDYLRNGIKFKGLVVTDWLAANTAQSTESLGAGIDVMGGAPSSNTDIDELVANIGIDRINEACRRVLDVKISLGMFENPYADPTCTYDKADHHAIVLNAAEKSITLLKNDGVLPLQLNTGDQIVVAGPRSSWASQNDDPNVIWQSIYYDDDQAKTYTQAIAERAAQNNINVYQDNVEDPKVAVIVIGEQAYTHGTEWNDKNPNIPDEQLDVIRSFHDAGIKTITVIIMPRPYVLTPLVDISDAILVVYRGGTGIGQATAACLFGDYQPTGRLPFQLPKSDEQIGTDDLTNMLEKWELPYDLGATNAEKLQIRNYIDEEQTVPPVFGDPLFQYGFGLQGFSDNLSAFSEQIQNNGLKVYPNPFKNVFTVEDSDQNGVLYVYDITGKCIYNQLISKEEQKINISDRPNGFYTVIVTSESGSRAAKIIKY
ncbi:MAG: glycoside hydrolase family 3 N-terminal domain-containing protein [Paludibacter sp.]|nr:glycoside hydrolase family 3 N-terminal domain-containing protein [Paludibacter sp.]